MPEESPSSQAGEYVREEMEHIRQGKHGARSTKQAIAIGLSKARQFGSSGILILCECADHDIPIRHDPAQLAILLYTMFPRSVFQAALDCAFWGASSCSASNQSS